MLRESISDPIWNELFKQYSHNLQKCNLSVCLSNFLVRVLFKLLRVFLVKSHSKTLSCILLP